MGLSLINEQLVEVFDNLNYNGSSPNPTQCNSLTYIQCTIVVELCVP